LFRSKRPGPLVLLKNETNERSLFRFGNRRDYRSPIGRDVVASGKAHQAKIGNRPPISCAGRRVFEKLCFFPFRFGKGMDDVLSCLPQSIPPVLPEAERGGKHGLRVPLNRQIISKVGFTFTPSEILDTLAIVSAVPNERRCPKMSRNVPVLKRSFSSFLVGGSPWEPPVVRCPQMPALAKDVWHCPGSNRVPKVERATIFNKKRKESLTAGSIRHQ